MTNNIKLTGPQRQMLTTAANDPNLRARAGHQKDATAQKLASLGLGTRAFYGSPVFYINKAGLRYLGKAIGGVQS